MHRSKEELRETALYKGKPQSNSTIIYRSVPSDSTTELNKAKSEKNELENKHKELKVKHEYLTKENTQLNNEKVKLEKEVQSLKLNDRFEEEIDKAIKENCHDREINTPKNIKISKPVFDKLAPKIDSIKSEHKVEDDNIIHKDSNTTCYGKVDNKLEKKVNDKCHKIHHLHKLMDSLGVDKDEKGQVDEGHKEFSDFIDSSNLDIKHRLSFNKLYDDYDYTCKKGNKVPIEKATAIKYKYANNSANDKECFKISDKKITTYGDNSFSDECAPIIAAYKALQDRNIPHYSGCDLKDYDDENIHELLKPNDAEDNIDSNI